MSTVINTTIPKTHESYTKRQRYEFEIFDKSIKEIENLFKQDIHTFKRPKLVDTRPSSNSTNDQHYTYTNQNDQRQLDDYLKKDKRNDSYKSLFSINKQAQTAVTQAPPSASNTQTPRRHHHHSSQKQIKDEYHQLRDLYRKKQLQKQHGTELKPLVHPSIINHIRLETVKKIDYYVNDISSIVVDESNELNLYNEDGLFLKNDKIIGNLINIIGSNKQESC